MSNVVVTIMFVGFVFGPIIVGALMLYFLNKKFKLSKFVGNVIIFLIVLATLLSWYYLLMLVSAPDIVDDYRNTATGECIKTSFGHMTPFGRVDEHIREGYIKDPTCKKPQIKSSSSDVPRIGE